jgi:hypothetical protein
MHAVVGIWTVDDGRRDEQNRALRQEVVPLTMAQHGFVCGYWMHDPETGKSHTTIVFDDEASAGAFKTFVEGRTRAAAQIGVTADILAMVEVIADSHGARRPEDTSNPTHSTPEASR